MSHLGAIFDMAVVPEWRLRRQSKQSAEDKKGYRPYHQTSTQRALPLNGRQYFVISWREMAATQAEESIKLL